MARSLRLKLVMFMALLLIAAMFVVGSFLINGVKSFYVDSFFDQMGQVFTQEYISQLDEASQSGPQKVKELLMSTSNLGINLSSRNAYVLSPSGEVTAGSDETSSVEMSRNILVAMESGKVGQRHNVITSQMDVAIPVGEGENACIVYILDSGEAEKRLSGEVMVIIVEGLALGVCISVVLSIMLSNILITPIERLRDGAERIAAGDFSQKLDVSSRDEIGVLTLTFNEMANVLQSTLDQMENEKNKLSTLFLHMTDGVLAFARDGSPIHSNPAAKVMLGLGEELPSYSDLFDVPFEKILQLRRPEFEEMEMQRGSKYIELYFAPFSEEGEQGGVLVLIHDITQQRKAEELRKEFVANVSHELRTPLTNVKSYAETLLDSPDLPPHMSEQFLNVILSEADRMGRIVQDLLTLSRFDYGRAELKKELFPFFDAVKNVYQAVGMDAKRRSQQLSLNMDGKIPGVRGDRSRVEQVIMNLVSNAIKYTPDGGTIELNVWAADGYAYLSVTDNGIGIPEEDIPRLFERFYRVDKARSRESGGTGLGLSIALEIIQQHEGSIDVKSALGEGTCVTVRLPAEENL